MIPTPGAPDPTTGSANSRSAGITSRSPPASAQLRRSFAPPAWCSYSTRMSYFAPAASVIESGGVGLQSSPQSVATSFWQVASQVCEQHFGSKLQIRPAQKNPSGHVRLTAAPVRQMSWLQVASSNPPGTRDVAVTSWPFT